LSRLQEHPRVMNRRGILCHRWFRNKQVNHVDEDVGARMNAEEELLSDRGSNDGHLFL
jgi:hypothetical protein